MKIINFRKADDGKAFAYFDIAMEDQRQTVYPNMKLVSKDSAKGGGWMVFRPSYMKGFDKEGKRKWGNYPEMEFVEWRKIEDWAKQRIPDLVSEPDPNDPF